MESYIQALAEGGFSITEPRRTVFSRLLKAGAIGRRDLLRQVEGKLDRATLYRTLSLLGSLGIVHDVIIGGKRKIELSDRFSPHHHHMSCDVCGTTLALQDQALEQRIAQVAASNGFQARSHSFEVSGICASCQK